MNWGTILYYYELLRDTFDRFIRFIFGEKN